MATGGPSTSDRAAFRVYEEDDVLDERLLNQISKWIMYHRLPSLARHLGISDAEISRIMIPSKTPEEQCFQIMKKWNERNMWTVKNLIEAMVEWHREEYVDPAVWEQLIRNKVNPALVPAPSVLQSLHPPPGGAGHSALHRLSHPPDGVRHPLELHNMEWEMELEGIGVMRRRVFVEESVRLSGQHLETSGQPIQSASHRNTLETLRVLSSSAIPTPIISNFPAPSASNAPETFPGPTISNAPETDSVPTSSNTPETVPAPTSHSAPESVPAITSSNVPETREKSCISSPEFAELQKKLKFSLHRIWKHALTHDWISPEKAKTLPLLEFYVGLRWTKVVKALKNYKVEMTSIYDILKIIDPDGELRPINIFVEAEPGMGKTCSLALLALKWVEGFDGIQSIPFDLVFLIRLRYVKKDQSLVEIIRKQHGGLKRFSNEYIESILEGETNHKVLLLLDGYDEYRPGTNDDIDKAIELMIGNCFLILTSRKGDYLSKPIRDKMDGEIIIEGFSKENIKACSTKYLGSRDQSEEMLAQAEETGIDVLLHIPIILVMTLVVFIQKESLPKTKTGIYETIFRLTMDRTTLKTFGCKSADISSISELLYALGELSWNALQNDVQQLLLKQGELRAKDPDLLKLGLLYEVGVDAATVDEPETLLCFQQKSLQEFSSSKHLAKRLDNITEEGDDVKETLNELFPCWNAVERHREVVVFMVGLMKDPRSLVNYLYEIWIQDYLKVMRTSDGDGKSTDVNIFKSIYFESTVSLPDHPLHNKYINYYNHEEDDQKNRPRDTNEIPTRSRLYVFWFMRENIRCDIEHGKEDEAEEIPPECAIKIYLPSASVRNSLLSTAQTIWTHQAVTDLYMFGVWSKDLTTAEMPIMSHDVRSLQLRWCVLPWSFTKNVLRQLCRCVNLQNLVLRWMYLKPVEDDLDELLEHIVSHHERGLNLNKLCLSLGGVGGLNTKTNLSKEFVTKWRQICERVSSTVCITKKY